MIPFALCSAVVLGSGMMAVRSRDLVHAVLWLGLSLVATAALYAVLYAGFMAAIQILLYTGGIVTLMLFAVMLVRPGSEAAPDGELRAGIVVISLVAAVISVILRSPNATAGTALETQALGAVLLGPLAVPFELLSVLLLAAMIGAIVLARKKDA